MLLPGNSTFPKTLGGDGNRTSRAGLKCLVVHPLCASLQPLCAGPLHQGRLGAQQGPWRGGWLSAGGEWFALATVPRALWTRWQGRRLGAEGSPREPGCQV
ncbi:unnamed protein product [Lepidochelys kempii]